MNNNDDILSAFDLIEDTHEQEAIIISSIIEEEIIVPTPRSEISDAIASPALENKKTFSEKSKDSFVFLLKYFSTSICIFGILMLGANYSAYWNLAYSIIYAEEMEITKNSLIQSVAANNLEEKTQDSSEVNTFKQISQS